METSSRNKQENESAPSGIPDSVAEKGEAALLEARMKACASLIRTR